MNGAPSGLVPVNKQRITFGWSTCESSVDSERRSASASSDVACSGCSTFTATRSPVLLSTTAYTVAYAPLPSAAPNCTSAQSTLGARHARLPLRKESAALILRKEVSACRLLSTRRNFDTAMSTLSMWTRAASASSAVRSPLATSWRPTVARLSAALNSTLRRLISRYTR